MLGGRKRTRPKAWLQHRGGNHCCPRSRIRRRSQDLSGDKAQVVQAFGGTELVRRGSDEEIKEEYRFYSYGDAMLIL